MLPGEEKKSSQKKERLELMFWIESKKSSKADINE